MPDNSLLAMEQAQSNLNNASSGKIHPRTGVSYRSLPPHTNHDFLADAARPTPHSLEAIWDDRSPFSVLPRVNGANRNGDHQRASGSSNTSHFPAGESSTVNRQPISQGQTISQGVTQTGVRTLQEIEAEMRAAAQQSRNIAIRQQEFLLQQQQEQQEQQQQLHLQKQLLQQQQLLQMHQRTPPPRMLPTSQSPRFHDHQRQILFLQQQQKQQQQSQLQELQEQLRSEEAERQLRAQQLAQLSHGPSDHYNQQHGPSRHALVDIQSNQRRQHSPAFSDIVQQVPSQSRPPFPSQQDLLAELNRIESMRGLSHPEQEALRKEAMRKIVETEKMEEKRRRKAAKIAYMVSHRLPSSFIF
jgi:DNA topoisomerase 2-associated protein PAT1